MAEAMQLLGDHLVSLPQERICLVSPWAEATYERSWYSGIKPESLNDFPETFELAIAKTGRQSLDNHG
jgi:hypothetical protein